MNLQNTDKVTFLNEEEGVVCNDIIVITKHSADRSKDNKYEYEFVEAYTEQMLNDDGDADRDIIQIDRLIKNERISPDRIYRTVFKRSKIQLIDGDIVHMRNEERYIVCNNFLINPANHDRIPLDQYEGKLTYLNSNDKEYDIETIYRYDSTGHLHAIF